MDGVVIAKGFGLAWDEGSGLVVKGTGCYLGSLAALVGKTGSKTGLTARVGASNAAVRAGAVECSFSRSGGGIYSSQSINSTSS